MKRECGTYELLNCIIEVIFKGLRVTDFACYLHYTP